MSNIVDTSTETVNAEFDAAAEALGVDQPDTQPDAPNEALTELEQAQRQAEMEMAKGMIATALRFTVGGLVKVDVDDKHYANAADAYAVLIIKYFPGGIFALLDKYKEEIGAATATFVLVKVVRDAKSQKLAEEAAKQEQNRKRQAAATGSQPENSQEGQ